jgi:peroxiredoxin
MLKPGDEAPSIALPSRAGGTVSLRDFKGRNLPSTFSPKPNLGLNQRGGPVPGREEAA